MPVSSAYQPTHTAPPLSGAEASYQAASEAVTRLGLLALAGVAVAAAAWLDAVYAGWAGVVAVFAAAALASGVLATRLFRPFEVDFRTATKLNYTAVQNRAATDDPRLAEYLGSRRIGRWRRVARAASWAGGAWAAVIVAAMAVVTVRDLQASEVALRQVEGSYEFGEQVRTDDPKAVELRPGETRTVPVDPAAGARVITDVLTTSLPGLRRLEQEVQVARAETDAAVTDPTRAGAAVEALRRAEADARALARDPNLTEDARLNLVAYAETAKDTADLFAHTAASAAGGGGGPDDFPIFGQPNSKSCGPVCLQMVLGHLTKGRPDLGRLQWACGNWFFTPPEGLVDGYHDFERQAEIVRPASVGDLLARIDRGQYPVLLVRADNGALNFHYIVAYGRVGNRVMVADPSPEGQGRKFSDAAYAARQAGARFDYPVWPSIEADQLFRAIQFQCDYATGAGYDPGVIAQLGQRGYMRTTVCVTGTYNPITDLPGQILRNGPQGLMNGRTLSDVGLGVIKLGELLGNNPIGHLVRFVGEVVRFVAHMQQLVYQAIKILAAPLAAILPILNPIFKALGIDLFDGGGSGGGSGGGQGANNSQGGNTGQGGSTGQAGSPGGQAAGQAASHAAQAGQVGGQIGGQRAQMERLEQQLVGPGGGLSAKSKDLAEKARTDPAARDRLRDQVEKDLRRQPVTVKYTRPPSPADGGPEGTVGPTDPTRPNVRPVAAGPGRSGSIDAKTKNKPSQNDRAVGPDGSPIDP